MNSHPDASFQTSNTPLLVVLVAKCLQGNYQKFLQLLVQWQICPLHNLHNHLLYHHNRFHTDYLYMMISKNRYKIKNT